MGINCKCRAAARLAIKLTTLYTFFLIKAVLGKLLDNEKHTEFIQFWL